MGGPKPGIALNEHYVGHGDIVYQQACKLGCEGIVSKRLGSLYRSGRSKLWLKIKIRRTTRWIILSSSCWSMSASLPPAALFANADPALKVMRDRLQMAEQRGFLVEDHCDEGVVITAAPARRARWGSHPSAAVAALRGSGHLAAEVAHRVVETETVPTGDRTAQIQMAATATKPGTPTRAFRRPVTLVPRHRDARSVDQSIRRFSDHPANVALARAGRARPPDSTISPRPSYEAPPSADPDLP